MRENDRDTIVASSDVGVALRHLVERSSYHQKLDSHISKLRGVLFFDVTTVIDGPFIQDYQGCNSLGTGA